MTTNPDFPRFARQKSAFGLLELTIAMGLLAVLALLTVGGIRNVVTASRSTKCLSQLKQIYVGLALYTQDYNGRFPPATDPGTRDYTWDVPWRGLWCAPSALPEKGFPGYIAGGIQQARTLMMCPQNLLETPNYQTPSQFRHYYLCNYDLMTSSGYSDAPASLREIELHNTVLLLEAATGTFWKGPGLPAREHNKTAWSRVGEVHDGRLNVLWADGHITSVSKQELTREDFERKPLP